MSLVLRLLAATTLVAGLVTVARQRREAVAVRAGRLAPATAAADLPPHRPAPGPLERLAGWVPPPPGSTPARLLTATWASPLTAVGLLLAALSGRRPRWDHRHKCWVATGVSSLSGRALRLVGAEANTVGQVVLARTEHPSPRLLAHEAVHVRQGERLGPLLLPAYLWLGACFGYRDHPLERAARLGARRATGTPTDTAEPGIR